MADQSDQFGPYEGDPPVVDVVAGLFTGRTSEFGIRMASIQRSHRFAVTDLFAMENMAAKSGKKTSEMIDLVLHAGLDAIKRKLPVGLWGEFARITPEQRNKMEKALPGFSSSLKAIAALNEAQGGE